MTDKPKPEEKKLPDLKPVVYTGKSTPYNDEGVDRIVVKQQGKK